MSDVKRAQSQRRLEVAALVVIWVATSLAVTTSIAVAHSPSGSNLIGREFAGVLALFLVLTSGIFVAAAMLLQKQTHDA